MAFSWDVMITTPVFPKLSLLLIAIFVIMLWKLIWYGLALYKTIEKKDKSWFVILFIGAFLLNDIGLLAIAYLWVKRERKPKKKKR